MDNIFIERLWRSLKYEAVYLHELTDGFKAKRVIDDGLNFCNTERPHSTVGGRTPAEVYDGQPVGIWISQAAYPYTHRLHNHKKMC
ncbi:MAG: transposase [Magnetovibrio sp.]|nr:transposase [Magnetovibrio sp.]